MKRSDLWSMSLHKGKTNLRYESRRVEKHLDPNLYEYYHTIEIPDILEVHSDDNREYFDLNAQETGIRLILYYRGYSKQEWIYEGSFVDDYDESTQEILNMELSNIGHHGLSRYDRYVTTCSGGFSFEMIKDVINMMDVDVIGISAKIKTSEDAEDERSSDYYTDEAKEYFENINEEEDFDWGDDIEDYGSDDI